MRRKPGILARAIRTPVWLCTTCPDDIAGGSFCVILCLEPKLPHLIYFFRRNPKKQCCQASSDQTLRIWELENGREEGAEIMTIPQRTPYVEQLMERIWHFWIPDEVMLYIGRANSIVQATWTVLPALQSERPATLRWLLPQVAIKPRSPLGSLCGML